jgi:hypothetical protein
VTSTGNTGPSASTGTKGQVLKRLLLWFVMLGGFIALVTAVILPLAAEATIRWLPRSAEVPLGHRVEADVLRKLIESGKMPNGIRICSYPPGLAALGKVFEGLNKGLPDDINLRVTVMEADFANAMAMPGDRILIFSKLIEMTDHPNALAGVIAHELGHVVSRDPIRVLVERGSGTVLLRLLVGEKIGDKMDDLISQKLLIAANTREMEHSADVIALNLMRKAGWDSTAFAGFFATLRQQYGAKADQPALFATHPATKDRMDYVLNAPKTGDNLALGDQDWANLKAVCSQTVAPKGAAPAS